MKKIPGVRSIKTKTALVVALVAALLAALVVLLSTGAYHEYLRLRTAVFNNLIDVESERVDEMILRQAANVRALALAGEVLHRTGAWQRNLGEKIVTDNLRLNSFSLGGGLFFEPFAADPGRARLAYYAIYRDGHVVFDSEPYSGAYDYHSQAWYKIIRAAALVKPADDGKIVRTPPYYNHSGDHSLICTLGYGVYDQAGGLVGLSMLDLEIGAIAGQIAAIRPTENSFAVFADMEHDYILAASDKNAPYDPGGRSLSEAFPWLAEARGDASEIDVSGVPHIAYVNEIAGGLKLFVFIPKSELFQDINELRRRVGWVFIAALILIAAAAYLLLDHLINKPVSKLARLAASIGAGDLEARADLNTGDELGELAKAMSRMSLDIRGHIERLGALTAEKERIRAELDIGRAIQSSMLPSVFPPFPERGEMDIYALMRAAREVGGDFYDFFLIDEKRLVLVIADVSGKGVPAALFMVVAKTLIKHYILSGLDAGQAAARANAALCENNPYGMFVTAFIAVLDLAGGEMSCVNAGHNPPLIRRAGGTFERLSIPPDFVLGGLAESRYSARKIILSPGDFLCLYTDGVTEAVNAADEFFGEPRFLDLVNGLGPSDPLELLTGVDKALAGFAGEAAQNDDITMVGLLYRGVREFLSPAGPEALGPLLAFAEAKMEAAGLSGPAKMQLLLAIEELCVNTVSYAGGPDRRIKITVEKEDNPPTLVAAIADDGQPFNPVAAQDPDLTLPEAERGPGGLGIFLAKKNVDEMNYQYQNGWNKITLKKRFQKSH